MKNYYKTFAIILIATISYGTAQSQSKSKSVYVYVHGMTAGGWAYKNIDSMLTASGNIFYRPTLTGLGERAHLTSSNITLKVHILDVVNTILYEDLHDIILVGHSYGGMVTTGVADSIPKRIKKLIYIDAFLPEDGESVLSITGNPIDSSARIENGLLYPKWLPEGHDPPKGVPHPVLTFIDDIRLTNPRRLEIPSTYILTVEKNLKPEDDMFFSAAERAKKKGWTVLQLEADHSPERTALKELVKMLQEIVNK
ncbi:MAG: alpha/beta fold hydrolase [Flavobacteriaceae bacterium]|tara:strand:+ start:1332 stop:2093 length:762 start_codon:yes stop_codon:yes gene_type:complete